MKKLILTVGLASMALSTQVLAGGAECSLLLPVELNEKIATYWALKTVKAAPGNLPITFKPWNQEIIDRTKSRPDFPKDAPLTEEEAALNKKYNLDAIRESDAHKLGDCWEVLIFQE